MGDELFLRFPLYVGSAVSYIRGVSNGDFQMTRTITASLTLKIGRKAYAIESLADASRKVCAARDKAGIGSSRFTPPSIFDGERQVGYVSYNGRVWAGEPRGWKAGDKPIYDNGAGV